MRILIFAALFTYLVRVGALASSYDGALFDTHTHHDFGNLTPLKKQMTDHRVSKAVLFSGVNPEDVADSDEIWEEDGVDANTFVSFFHVDPKKPSDMAARRLGAVVSNSKFKFWGVGELGLYRKPWQTTSLADPIFTEVFEFASTHKIFVMIHPRHNQLNELAARLARHPNTRFLVHGIEHDKNLVTLAKNYENLFLTIDTSSLLRVAGEPLMFNSRGGKSYFIDAFDTNYQSMLKAALETMQPLIAAAPSRVMWGTDVAFTWHTHADVYTRLIRFSREFIGKLNEENRVGYAVRNARRAFESETL